MNTVMNPTTGTIQRYRRKPLVVEAWQWWPEMEVPDPCLYRIKAGDWILKDLSTGQMSIVKHPTFKAMFELLPAMPISRALKG